MTAAKSSLVGGGRRCHTQTIPGVDLSIVPETHHDLAREALDAAFGARAIDIKAVRGGASGALTFKVSNAKSDWLLRLEANQTVMRNGSQYECMRIASDLGVAPPILYLNPDHGVVVLPFVEQQPIAELGTPDHIAVETARLLAVLHRAHPFPSNGDYFDNVRRAINFLEFSGRVAPGLLQPHVNAFEEIVAVYPWMPGTFVSADNDPNPFNLLYDGKRLWLIDWETAARNDPFVDLAIAANNHTLSADVSEALLSAYLDAPVDDQARARLALMQVVVRLWSGLMMLVVVSGPEAPQHTDLTAPSPEEFMEALASGRLSWNTPATSLLFAKLMLRVFLEASRTPDTARWRAIAAASA